jgi:hypothetical protein
MDIKQFIFLTSEGITYQPILHGDDRDIVENLQVVGFASGENAEQAFCNLVSENLWLKELSFKNIFSYPLCNDYEKQITDHKIFTSLEFSE